VASDEPARNGGRVVTVIALSQPIGPTASVTVRVPAEFEWDAAPPGVQVALWNLARSTGLTLNQAAQLHRDDIAKIATAFEREIAVWNSGQMALRAVAR